MSPRGNPLLNLRIEPELMEKVQSAFPAVKGRSGGASLAIRKLLHTALDVPISLQYGETGRLHQIDELEAQLRELEPLPFNDDKATVLKFSARKLLATTEDAVDVLRLRALLGRLQLWEQPLTSDEKNGKS